MLLLSDQLLEERRRLVRSGGPLAPLCDSIAAELEPWLTRDVHVPEQKALLSREGGRCPRDGTALEFDPASPRAHRCPACGVTVRGERHDRAWITWYQLWLAERAVHAGLLHLLRGDERHAEFSRRVLRALGDRYVHYPNRDNVLGPTRPFFSTYLESIWLLQVCVATDLLRAAGDAGVLANMRERVIEPSRALIADFNEGMSNRQVWNNAALMAAARLCDDEAAFRDRVDGPGGLRRHLSEGLLTDGTWYEGDNYHQFALRGLWYGVQLAESSGVKFGSLERRRYACAFAAPFLTALPDFTMPSRKDSQYAVSLRQWRLAELAELGYARTGDPVLADALARIYEPGHERRDTGRSRSAADAERNAPSGALTRADLGWRALLHAVPQLPAPRGLSPRSVHMVGQGYAVFRREHDVYVGFDYGQSGGGHAHPDRLNLTLYQGTTRWLDDLGTGSYVDPSLHWYRSTLAHNAPLIDGRSQPLRDGRLEAYDERESLGWIVGSFDFDEGGTTCRRLIVVGPDYLIDELRWSATRPVRVDLPVHLDAMSSHPMQPAALDGGDAREDGFGFVKNVEATDLPAGTPATLQGREAASCRALIVSSADVRLYRVTGPGQPATVARAFHLVRVEPTPSAKGPGAGVIRMILSWSERQPDLAVDAEGRVTVDYRDGERHLHQPVADTWHVDLFAGGARSSIDLGGGVSRSTVPAAPPSQEDEYQLRPAPLPSDWVTDHPGLLRFSLGREHYRRSEIAWEDAGRPAAEIALATDGRTLLVLAVVRAGDRSFAAADAENPYDNEHPDTLRAGVQLHVRFAAVSASWMLIPEPGGGVRLRQIGGGPAAAPSARWRDREGESYEMRVELPLPGDATAGDLAFAMDLLVNETVRDRVRRRGQLVLSGAPGEFVYLRGDRQDVTRFLRVRVKR